MIQNQTNASNTSGQIECKSCYQLVYYIENLVDFIVCIIGIVCNILCILVFSHKEFHQKTIRFDLFKYYLIRSLLDLIYFIVDFSQIYNYTADSTQIVAFSPVYFTLLGFTSYASLLCELTATILIYVTINERLNGKLSTDYRLVTIGIFIFSAALNWHRPFNGRKETDFSQILSLMNIINRFVRDVVFIVLLVVANLLLVYEFKRNQRKKRRLIAYSKSFSITGNSTQTNNQNGNGRTSLQAKPDLTLMTILIGLKTVIFQFPIFFISFQPFSNDFIFVGAMFVLFDISFAVSFFIYLFFNRKFSSILRRFFESIFSNAFKFLRILKCRKAGK